MNTFYNIHISYYNYNVHLYRYSFQEINLEQPLKSLLTIYVDFRIETSLFKATRSRWTEQKGSDSVVWPYVSRGASKNRVLSSALSPPLKGVRLSWPVCRVEPLVLRQSDPKCKVSDGTEENRRRIRAERTSIKPRHGDEGETALKWICYDIFISIFP